MSRGGFVIALVVTYLLQTSVVGVLGLRHVDLFLTLALLYGLLARAQDAPLAAWGIGLAQDLGTLDPLGIHAFCLGLVALAATRMRAGLNVSALWPRALVSVASAWMGMFAYRAFMLLRTDDAGSWWSALGGSLGTALIASGLALLITLSPRADLRGRARHFSSRRT